MAGFVFGQKKSTKVEIVHADKAIFNKAKYGDAQNLYGDVQLKHQGILMNCDSARLYQVDNKLVAYGEIVFNQGDTIFLYGKYAEYNGNTRRADVTGDVKLIDQDVTLESPTITFFRDDQVGVYNQGGRIVSKENDNVLTSKVGHYQAHWKQFVFTDSVELYNADYRILTDTMHYKTETEEAFFFGPTQIISDSNLLEANAGWYDTNRDIASFSNGAKISNKENSLDADSLFYDRNKGLGKAFGHVFLADTVNDWLLFGDYAEMHELKDSAIFPTNPMMVFLMDEDSLFMRSDTVVFYGDSANRKMEAFHEVRFYMTDFQGVADSVTYNQQDSILKMRMGPVMWSDQSQITGTKIDLHLADGGINELRIPEKSLIVQSFDSLRFNQVQGRSLRGEFVDNELKTIHINGNGETIYYVIDENPDTSVTTKGTLIGINKAVCSDMRITIADNQINEIYFITQPQSTLYPGEKESETTNFRLKNFIWLGDKRPTKLAVVKGK